jgi:putative chitinase
VTGKSNYAKLSGWAFEHGYVDTRDYFVVNPERLDDDEYAFLGVTWYWTTQRPMNAAADARNLELATRYVNGGTNGLEDRRGLYNRALAKNADLLPAAPADPLEALMATEIQSWSIYATPGEKPIPAINLLAAIDAKIHRDLTDEDARAGDVSAIQRVARTAAGQGANKSAGAVAHATRVLNEIYATNPAFIIAATPGKAQP